MFGQWSNNLQHEESVILRQLFIDGGMGGDASLNPTVAWPVYATNEPSTPDNCISIWDTTGQVQARAMNSGQLIQKCGFQVRVRATDSLTGKVKANALQTWMAQNVYQADVTLNDAAGNNWNYVVWAIINIGNVLAIGLDKPDTQRELFTINAMVRILLAAPFPAVPGN